MPRLSLHALITAFSIEVLVDMLVARTVFVAFAGDLLAEGMSEAELKIAVQTVYDTTTYLQWMFMFGMATTLGGAYLAARLARRIPYYHGLAMGIIGLVFVFFFWQKNPGWIDYLALLLTIPVSLLGSHLARQRMQALEIL